MAGYKLVYFNGRGRAETTRLLFALSEIEYEDVRISIEQWPALKPKTFAGYLPFLEVDGQVLVESMAIARFVAREGNLAGACSFEQAQIDSILDILTNVFEKGVQMVIYAEPDDKAKLRRELVEKTFPYVLKLLEKFLQEHQYFVNDKLSLADLHFFSVFESATPVYDGWPDLSPKLKALYDRVAATPRISEYLKKRPATLF
ncbi:hypothetical protein HELRODRAFT_159857 [Helobdella robusta]|uniref:glutathione transferase n=1 Tax=Helobdella robusta TaxID=6412 RepID=T1EPH1_HELRO|nr:hypothetical protein HELRODRAFT_159857 [Helobdella robusta]ESO13221.1 hypothetical protein HELRODRAFT_159857 [Helobdella robusta]